MSQVVVTEKIIEKIVEKVLKRKLADLLSDPDYGLELKRKFLLKLKRRLKNKNKLIDEKEIMRKYNVKV